MKNSVKRKIICDQSLVKYALIKDEIFKHKKQFILMQVASTRLLGKRPDQKLKSITIIHSSTTETVRLPPEGTGGVTVHPPAVRAKLPLSRKVREKRHRRKHKDANSSASTANEKSSKVNFCTLTNENYTCKSLQTIKLFLSKVLQFPF